MATSVHLPWFYAWLKTVMSVISGMFVIYLMSIYFYTKEFVFLNPFTFIQKSLFALKDLYVFEMTLSCLCKSALHAFEWQVVYSNVIKDCILYISTYWKCIQFLIAYIFIWCSFIITLDIVGWRTASIRDDRENLKVC
jgi:hypothetical protein